MFLSEATKQPAIGSKWLALHSIDKYFIIFIHVCRSSHCRCGIRCGYRVCNHHRRFAFLLFLASEQFSKFNHPGMSSGAHFNPSFTVAMATWRGMFTQRGLIQINAVMARSTDFPWRKVPRYILSQVFGAFLAGLVVYCQYRPYLEVNPWREICCRLMGQRRSVPSLDRR